jgi:hypothetical protein
MDDSGGGVSPMISRASAGASRAANGRRPAAAS